MRKIPKPTKKEYYSTIKGYGLHFVKQKNYGNKLELLFHYQPGLKYFLYSFEM